MLTANLAVDMRFANGTQAGGSWVFVVCQPWLRKYVFALQGRLFWWTPGGVDSKKALPSSHPELLARFAKEASVKKAELFPDIDTLDIQVRQEPLRIRGEPQMVQLPLVPAYALTTAGEKGLYSPGEGPFEVGMKRPFRQDPQDAGAFDQASGQRLPGGPSCLDQAFS